METVDKPQVTLRQFLAQREPTRGLPMVTAMADTMLTKLELNAHKGWPEEYDVIKLLKHLGSEVVELTEAAIAHLADGNEHTADAVMFEAADVACLAAFVAEVLGCYRHADKHL